MTQAGMLYLQPLFWVAETALPLQMAEANGTSERINNLFRTYNHMLVYLPSVPPL